jgi:PIN domain nuclease of toxin-antitoxin system
LRELLVDTHAALWVLEDAPQVPDAIRRLVTAEAPPRSYISVASIWEVAIKVGIGKLEAPPDLVAAAEASNFAVLPIEPRHAWRVRELPHHHRDPFDRLLVAQAIEERLPIVSADPRFDAYGVERIWE